MKKFCILLFSFILFACATEEDPIKKEVKNMTSKEVYLLANEALQKSNYERAIKLYNVLELTYPYGLYAQQGMLDLAYAYYKNSNIPMALATLDQFILIYPTNLNKDYALYLKGIINYKGDDNVIFKYLRQDPSELDIDNLKQSYFDFNQLVNEFPNSKYSLKANLYIKDIINSLAKSEIYKANYYMSIKAYLSAINHTQQILINYKGSIYIEEALAIEVVAYKNLSQNELSSDTQKVLILNFPNSKYITNPWRENSMSWYKIFN
jgi:outer membrane protein assembly factor BamD